MSLELLGVSPGSGSKLCTTFLNIAKHGEITKNFQFTGTVVQPLRNQKLIQFNNAHDCMTVTELATNELKEYVRPPKRSFFTKIMAK